MPEPAGLRRRPGPGTDIGDAELVVLIRRVLADSPFAGEGYRKVPARLRREHRVQVGGKRVLRLMRQEGLLAPQRVRGRRRVRPHDGTIIPDGPNLRWGTDATMAWTRLDGWVCVFVCVDHYTAESWTHVAKRGDRIAALQPVYDAVSDRYGELRADVARGVNLRHDWGPQYRSHHFLGSIRGLGITGVLADFVDIAHVETYSSRGREETRLVDRLPTQYTYQLRQCLIGVLE